MTALSNVIAAGLGLSLIIFLLGIALSLIPDPAFSPSIPADDPDSDPSSGNNIELRDLKPRKR